MFLSKKNYELTIPKTYMDINREEIGYIDGGYRPSRSVYINPGSKRMSTVTFTARAAAVNGISSALVCTVASALLPATASLNKWATTIYNTLATTLIKEKAKQLDAEDGVIDGWLTVKWAGKYVTEYNPYPPNSYQGAMF
ncbi:hypothetical protein [Clostridium paraputrificum]|uniref:hypothetical protein n=1 Tax=Clostridium paraputrificum TaxID=29363 RepID=UPI0006C04D93|nr:hypothetical protein [Clostridium paraputrificum]CUO75894.1 Uncharacterised protein [Clostridium paraputrificum]